MSFRHHRCLECERCREQLTFQGWAVGLIQSLLFLRLLMFRAAPSINSTASNYQTHKSTFEQIKGYMESLSTAAEEFDSVKREIQSFKTTSSDDTSGDCHR